MQDRREINETENKKKKRKVGAVPLGLTCPQCGPARLPQPFPYLLPPPAKAEARTWRARSRTSADRHAPAIRRAPA